MALRRSGNADERRRVARWNGILGEKPADLSGPNDNRIHKICTYDKISAESVLLALAQPDKQP